MKSMVRSCFGLNMLQDSEGGNSDLEEILKELEKENEKLEVTLFYILLKPSYKLRA